MLGRDLRLGLQAVVANEEAFRRSEAQLKEDERAVREVSPRLQETRQTLQSMRARIGRDIGREEREGVAYVGDEREARLLGDSEGFHKLAGQAAARASAVHGKIAEALLDQGRHYLDLSSVDQWDARDSGRISELMRGRQP
jgi:hypothetical protein